MVNLSHMHKQPHQGSHCLTHSTHILLVVVQHRGLGIQGLQDPGLLLGGHNPLLDLVPDHGGHVHVAHVVEQVLGVGEAKIIMMDVEYTWIL